jgi:hypothetical protein
MKFQAEVFWVVTPKSVVVGYQHFGGPCCLHLQCEVNGAGKRANGTVILNIVVLTLMDDPEYKKLATDPTQTVERIITPHVRESSLPEDVTEL